jgi:hypothetical protein
MNVVVIPHLALLLIVFGAAIVVAAQAIGRRFGGWGLLCYWLGASAVLAFLAARWAASVMPALNDRSGFFLIPLLFMLVEIGAVAGYVARSTPGRPHPRRQFIMGLLVFTAALIPALIAAQIPDIVRLAGQPG